MDKKQQLNKFFNEYKHLPVQNSEQWLKDRKYTIGGSEMGTIAGTNPFKNIRDLIENHVGLTSFNGNINTYWGSVLEDYTVQILETKWHCEIKETGSLPGAIPGQKYSPDGLVYLDFLDQIILLEIKNPIRRAVNGKIPPCYKPQIFTGLATIPIADRAMFVDSMFRRCSIKDYNFTTKHDLIIHPKRRVKEPLLLGAVFVYSDKQSKHDYGTLDNSFIDGGECKLKVLENILKDVKDGKLIKHFPAALEKCDDTLDEIGLLVKKGVDKESDYGGLMVDTFLKYGRCNNLNPVCILPLKLFRFDITLVEKDDWKGFCGNNVDEFSNFVEYHKETIDRVISNIRELDGLPTGEMKTRLDELYPDYNSGPNIDEELINEIIKELMV